MTQNRGAKAVAVVGALALTLGIAACGQDEPGKTSPSADGNGTGSAAAVSGELEILVSSASASDAAFEAVNKAFMAKYPDVKITFSTVSNDNYPATKSSRLTAGNVDIAVVKNFVEVPEFAADSTSDDVLLAKADGWLDLTDQPFMKNYTSSVLDAQAIGGKQYAIPTGLSYSTGVYYNKSLFADNGLEVPTTWTELQNVMSTLKGKGVTPFGIGGKDTWPAGLAMLGVVGSQYPSADAKSGLTEELWTQKTKLTDELPMSVMTKTQTLFENAQPKFAGTGYDEIPAAFAKGDFAMIFDGTWNEPTIRTAVADQFEYGYFPLPASDTAADNASLNGKIELQLAIPSGSKNQPAALAWFEFFSDPANYASFVETSGFSPAQQDVATSEFLKSISSYTETFQPAWDTIWIANNNAGQDAVYPFNYPAIAPLGSSDAKAAAEAAQTAWQGAF